MSGRWCPLGESLLDHVRDAVVHAAAIREGGRIVDFEYLTVNAAARDVLGGRDVLGRRLLEVFGELSGSDTFDRLVDVVETGRAWTSSQQRVELEGTERWFEGRAEKRGHDELVLVFTDVTVPHHLRTSADRARRRAEQVLETVSDGIYALDEQWRFTYVNPAAERLIGRDRQELLGRPTGEVFPESVGSTFDRHFREVFARRTPVSFEAHFPEPIDAWYANRVYPAADGGGVVVYFRDVTERRRTETRLRHLQRLEDLGALAMTLAHDFNNLATVINGSLYLLRKRLDDGRSEEDLGAIGEAARASEELARRLVAFGNVQQLSPQEQTVNGVLKRMRPLVERLVRTDIQVTVCPAEPDVAFRADPDQLDRVLLNLVSNADQSMPGSGRLTLSGGVRAVRDGLDHGPASVRDYVAFEVADTGVGMDDETRQRAGEPLFTTRTDQAGVGLGLATAEAFATQSGGWLRIESTLDVGTTITLLLPAGDNGAVPTP